MKTWVSEALHEPMHACHKMHLAGMSAMKQWKLADSLKPITLASRVCAFRLYGGSALPMTESSTRQRTRNNGEEGGQERGKELKWKGERKENETVWYFGRSQVWIPLECHHARVRICSLDTKLAIHYCNAETLGLEIKLTICDYVYLHKNRSNPAFTVAYIALYVSLKCIIL